MDAITFSFRDDNRTVEIPKEVFDDYPCSSIYGYLKLVNENSLLLEDITYNDFNLVINVLLRKNKQWKVPDNIKTYMDENGLINDHVNKIQKGLILKMHEALETIDNFIHGDHPMMIAYEVDLYELMERVLMSNTDFVSVQITFFKGKVVCIHLSGMLPIFRQFIGFKYFDDNGIAALLPNDDENIIDIYKMRENMFYSHMGHEGEKFTRSINKEFYSLDNYPYFKELHSVIKKNYGGAKGIAFRNKNFSDPEFYNFDVNFSESVCNNKKLIMEKIIQHVLNSVGRIPISTSPDINVRIKQPKIMKAKCDTYFGFINLNNLLSDQS